jgi:hypothetical protein
MSTPPAVKPEAIQLTRRRFLARVGSGAALGVLGGCLDSGGGGGGGGEAGASVASANSNSGVEPPAGNSLNFAANTSRSSSPSASAGAPEAPGAAPVVPAFSPNGGWRKISEVFDRGQAGSSLRWRPTYASVAANNANLANPDARVLSRTGWFGGYGGFVAHGERWLGYYLAG